MILQRRNDLHRFSFVVLLTNVLLLAAVTTNSIAQTSPDIPLLVLNQPVERELAGGQSHSYQLTLTAGQYLHVVAEQRGIDVVVVLFGPDSKNLIEIDSPNGTQGPEPLTWITESSGSYRLEIRSLEKEAKAGRYEVKIAALRLATESDRALVEAQSLSNEAESLRIKGKFAEAIPLADRALKLKEQSLDPKHLDVATSLGYLAELYEANGEYVKAEPFYQRALTIREKALGPDHPQVVELLNNLALLYREKGDYAKAEPLYQRALAALEKALGPEHLDVAASLNGLAVLYYLKGDYAKAEPLYQRALAIREKALGPDHPLVAWSLSNLAVLYYDKGDYAKAEPLHQRALAIREKVLGPDHPDFAGSLNNLAVLYTSKGDYAKAEPFYQRALAIREKSLGSDHPDVAQYYNNLGLLYYLKGDYAKAEPLYQRALTIREKTLGPDHPDVAQSLDNLAFIYRDKGNYAKAEPLYQRALTIRGKTLGPEHPNVARSLNSLALFYQAKGDYAKAEPLFQRGLVIMEKVLGPEHPDAAVALNNLALLYRDKGDYAKAEPLYQRALAALEKSLGSDHPMVATFLNNLAALYYDKGDYAKVEPLYQRGLTIREKVLGPEHPDVAFSLNNLAALYNSTGDYAKAETHYQRALTFFEKVLGPDHPYVATSLSNVAWLATTKGDMPQAVAFRARSNIISERNLALNLVTGSERQKLAYIATLSGVMDQTISLHVRQSPADATARNLSATIILQRKGRILDAVTDGLSALRRRSQPRDQLLLDEWKETSARLAGFLFGSPQKIPLPEQQKLVNALEEKKEQLEAEISRHSDGFRAQTQSITVEAVQAAIPAEAALIEFALYRPFNPKYTKSDEQFGPPRYVAYVLRRQGEIQWAELDEVKMIDEAIEAWRQALRDPKRQDVKTLARAVDQLVMQPIRPLLGPTSRLLLSPDGALNLIPFAALVDESGQYLVHRYEFSYLTSGRDLLRLQIPSQSRQGELVIADPDFGASPDKAAAQEARTTGRNFDLSQAYFTSLPGTAEEAAALKTMLPQATVLTRDKATEAAIKQVNSPRLLHIATHGFFLEDTVVSVESERNLRRQLQQGESVPTGRLENPLLRSGLGLAGANARKSGEDDGILTAQEVAGLDLWGTKLVVLSACDTGVGEVKNGEGVYGLRRALVLAGAESQVMSLWQVSDQATRDLMIAYYRRLQAGGGRSEALRQVQLDMLRSTQLTTGEKRGVKPMNDSKVNFTGRSHPYYWASFIPSGEWANLAGRR